ncbi:MAG: DUF6364 family protein [Spirochaetia bacterium]|nr:DUF6364 family protein [Spirochaetia bacterium]
MLTKLTLTIDQSVVEQAKEYAQKKNRSVSRIVEEYLKNLTFSYESESSLSSIKSPITDSISGMFTDNGKSYKDMLEEALQEKYL